MSQATFASIERYLTPREAAAYLRIGFSTLSIYRMKRIGPKFIKWANNIRYDISDLDEWMAERRVIPESPSTTERARVGRPQKIKEQEGQA